MDIDGDSFVGICSEDARRCVNFQRDLYTSQNSRHGKLRGAPTSVLVGVGMLAVVVLVIVTVLVVVVVLVTLDVKSCVMTLTKVEMVVVESETEVSVVASTIVLVGGDEVAVVVVVLIIVMVLVNSIKAVVMVVGIKPIVVAIIEVRIVVSPFTEVVTSEIRYLVSKVTEVEGDLGFAGEKHRPVLEIGGEHKRVSVTVMVFGDHEELKSDLGKRPCRIIVIQPGMS
jgi:hypothetical protein